MFKRIIFVLIAMLVMASSIQSQEKAPEPDKVSKPAAPDAKSDELYQKTKDIFDTIAKLESNSLPEQKAAFDKLLAMGPSVLPYLSSYLKDKGVFVELVSRIISSDKSAGYAKPAGSVAKISQDLNFTEKYFYGQFLNAQKAFDAEDYVKSKEIAAAILTLEKNLSFKNQVQLLKIQCEEMIIQRNLLKATLKASPKEGLPENIFEIGDKIPLTFKIENTSLQPLEIQLGENNQAMLTIDLNQYDPYGNFNNLTRSEEIPLKGEVLALKPGEKKEWALTLDTVKDFPKSFYYRTYTLRIEFRPLKIKSTELEKETGMDESIRKIAAPPVTLRIFPPEVKPVLQDPVNKLQVALAGGVPLDIFLCSLLVPEHFKPRAVEMLIKALENPLSKNSGGENISVETWETVIMNCLKHVTNLPFEINKDTWIDWFKNKKSQ